MKTTTTAIYLALMTVLHISAAENGVLMKDIQEWLGHSDFNTTANIYAHLDTASKSTSATRMTSVVSINPGISVNV